MRVLMLGWEFPPFIAGGLGTACYGLTRGMSEIGTDVLFLLPKPVQSVMSSHVTLVAPTGARVPGSTVYRMEEFEHVTFAALEAGVAVFDASVGGIGGCPFAPRATGNIATEDLVYLLHGEGVETGIDLEALIDVARWLEAQLGRELEGQVYKAGTFAPVAG